jgi:hypothetical protein
MDVSRAAGRAFTNNARGICFTLSVTNVDPAYAIIRLDLDPVYGDEDRYTVKRVVWSEDEASAKVARLNEVNASKNCRYFWQYTPVDQRQPEL